MGKIILRFFKIYVKLMGQQVKCMLEYKADFLIMITFSFLTQISGLFFIYLIFSQIPSIAGWNMWEVIFMYGMIYFTEGILTFLFEGTWLLGKTINSGTLDRFILRPLPIWMQIFTQKINPEGVGKITISLIIMINGLINMKINWTLNKFIWLIIFIVSASIIRICMNFTANSACFWLKSKNTVLAHFVHTVSEFGKYPITIFEGIIQFILIFIFPYAFISYFPTIYLLDRGRELWMGLCVPLMAGIWIIISATVFNIGLNRYDSPGN